ncbi:MAG: hypothetical protein ACLR3W_11710 [Faecalibacillus intestinalis]|uniref:hypothetical protein n=1 Tax=Faecalibacillus intestinalis TaxID=1982626 RepID=UPI003996742B
MKLFLDIIYVLIENLIYVMYLDLFFKNREEVKYNKIFFIVFMSFLSLMMNKYFAISYGGIILLIISLIYIHLFYDGDIYNKIIKLIFVNVNMLLINGLCMFLLNQQSLYYIVYAYDGYLGYLITFISKGIWLIEYFYLKKYLKEEFQLNKHIWFFVMITLVAIIFLDLYTFNEYLMNQMRLSSIICLYVVSLMMIVLIYILCSEMTQYYQRLMNRKIHEQALQYEETLVEIANQKSKKYNKIIHDYKKLVKDLKENQEIELQDISLEIPTEVIHTNNIVLNYVFNRYTEIMKEHQIDFYGTYSDQIYQGVSSYDLATILKFLLDHVIVLSQETTHKAIHYTIESQRYYTIIKIRCLIENGIVVDHHFKKNEYLIEEICRKYNGKKLSKIEDNQYIFGCYLENSGDLL